MSLATVSRHASHIFVFKAVKLHILMAIAMKCFCHVPTWKSNIFSMGFYFDGNAVPFLQICTAKKTSLWFTKHLEKFRHSRQFYADFSIPDSDSIFEILDFEIFLPSLVDSVGKIKSFQLLFPHETKICHLAQLFKDQ